MKAGEPLRFYFFQGEEDRQRGSKVNEEEEDEAGAFEPAAYLATCLFGLARTRLECLGSTWGVPLDPVTQTSSRRSAYQCGQATAGDRFSRKETPSVRMIGEAQGAAAADDREHFPCVRGTCFKLYPPVTHQDVSSTPLPRGICH